MLIVLSNKYLMQVDYFTQERPKPVDFATWPVEKQQAWKTETFTFGSPRAIMYRDRSKYKPHQGKKECARRALKEKLGISSGRRNLDLSEGEPIC